MLVLQILLISPFFATSSAILDHDAVSWLVTDGPTKGKIIWDLLEKGKIYFKDSAPTITLPPITDQEPKPLLLVTEHEPVPIYSRKPEYEEPDDDVTRNTERPPCPAEKSLHTENDINDMIKHLINDKGVASMINSSFYAQFMNVRNTHEQRLHAFLDWFHTRPEHLKHILKSLEHTRLRLHPFVKKHEKSLKKYSELEISYNEKSQQIKKLHEKLQRYKSICELSCEDKNTELLLREQVLTPSNYYCSSIGDLYNDVNVIINKDIQLAEFEITNRLRNLTLEQKHEIDILINTLKDVALVKFGRTMYDILELQDKYIHFEELVKTDLESLISEMEMNIDQTASKLKELERIVEKVRAQCAKCNSMDNMVNLQRSLKTSLNTRQQESDNIVGTLVALNMKSLINTLEEQFLELFASLVNTIDENKRSVDNVMEKLNPIQNEIAEMTKEESAKLEHLKSIVSDLLFVNVHDLHVKSQLLIISLNEIEIESQKTIDYYR